MKINVLLIVLALVSTQIHAQSAVLSTGSWHRITVSENGIYRITYDELLRRGVLQSPVPVSQIALFGGPNGAIPVQNIANETFDLQEIAIFVSNNSGMFGPGNYILFYGQSPHTWTWNTTLHRNGHHNHTNVFTDVMVYFLTTNFSGNGKRIENKPTIDGNPDVVITNFRDFFLHERDLVNPFRSSQEWFGERMDPVTRNISIDLHLPGLITDSLVDIRTRVVVSEPAMAVVSANNNHNRQDTLFIRRNRARNAFMMDTVRNFSWNFTSERPRISFEYTRLSNNPSWMHLDYMFFHYRRRLSLENPTMPLQFRSTDQTSGIGRFEVRSANQTTQVWDISNPLNPKKIICTDAQLCVSTNIFTFSANLSDTLEFIGFSETHIRPINQFEPVRNQNFHAETDVEYVMVVHPDFREEAERLADFHRSRNLNVLLVSPQEVFNEFSYGRQDPMAIRRMMRHYRRKALEQDSEVLPRYLLLFGSPSFDYRNRAGNGQNFVLNYQFPMGLFDRESFSTDDFFGFLNDGETGFQNTDSLRIGIGRFPARTPDQARTLVTKTIDYATPSLRNFGDWRNVVTNLADDGNFRANDSVTDGFFVRTFESNLFEGEFQTNFREINVEKIYFDAFPQVATPSGARFPAAKEALRQRVERGTLILNYQGHSGPVSLADEQIMTVADIQNYSNFNQLTVFFTGSCNFAQYDDPNLVSGGEWSVLSPRGGAVAHIGASRVAWTSPNDRFHAAFNRYALMRHNNGNARSLGEIMKLSKNRFQGSSRRDITQFVLLGDPAISLALPKHRIITDSINGVSVKDGIDTIRALGRASISGRIVDFDSTHLSDFNGEINITVFDKPTMARTLGSRNSSSSQNNPIIEYSVQNNILFRGRVPVINGEFRAEFMAPKSMNYTYGFGKISYYAFDTLNLVDATGVFDEVIIGGFGEHFDDSANAPIVELFLNNTNFRSGNISHPNPTLYAIITDEYGVSHSGAGIGHNIALVINDDFQNQVWLNEFFEYLPDIGDGKSRGRVEFNGTELQNLAPGRYHLMLRVSNVFNVSADATLEFVVVDSNPQIIGTLYNYPNPAREHTRFYFTHNAPQRIKQWQIDIFDVSGRWITQLTPQNSPQNSSSRNGFAIATEEWNLRDGKGNLLRRGMYLYRLRIVFEDGSAAEKTKKLIIDH